MFADLGHFSQLSIQVMNSEYHIGWNMHSHNNLSYIYTQIAFSFVVYPSLILAYMGQAAYLSKHHILESEYHIGFYVSVPGNFLFYM